MDVSSDRELPEPSEGAEEVDLHLCPECSSDLVYPLEWAPVDSCHWRVDLRCPECEWRGSGLYEQAVLDRFDNALDEGTDAMVVNLRRLQRTNMEAELERFGMALSTDLILPEDF
jgi:hypothetical protein